MSQSKFEKSWDFEGAAFLATRRRWGGHLFLAQKYYEKHVNQTFCWWILCQNKPKKISARKMGIKWIKNVGKSGLNIYLPINATNKHGNPKKVFDPKRFLTFFPSPYVHDYQIGQNNYLQFYRGLPCLFNKGSFIIYGMGGTQLRKSAFIAIREHPEFRGGGTGDLAKLTPKI